MGDLLPRLRFELQSDIKLHPTLDMLLSMDKEVVSHSRASGCELKGKRRGQEIKAINLG